MMYVCGLHDVCRSTGIPTVTCPAPASEERREKKERRWKKLFAPQAELDLQYIAIALPPALSKRRAIDGKARCEEGRILIHEC